jgi:dTDP-4-dehydrorhamnose reductase
MSTTVILFGSSGMLGNTIYKYFKFKRIYEVICINRSHFDILKNDNHDLYNLFKIFPENCVIINAIGLIPHSGNNNENDYYKINGDFPKLLDELCNTFHHTFIHITTDCVFNGKNTKNIDIAFKGYTENDVKNEDNIYGKSKASGEELTNATIIRTSIIGEQDHVVYRPELSRDPVVYRPELSRDPVVYRPELSRGESKINKHNLSLLQWVRSQTDSVINGYSNHYWNGVTCLRLAELIHKMIEKKLFWIGVRHIFTDKHSSKYDLIIYINEIYNLNLTIKKMECPTEINKTLSTNHINNAILNEYCGNDDIYQQIKDQMLFFKE